MWIIECLTCFEQLFFLKMKKTHSQFFVYRQCISASCFEFQKMFYQKKKKKKLLLKTFSFPLITCMREYSLFCFVFSHSSNKSSRALYFSHTDLFALPNNIFWLQVSLGLLHARATHILWPPHRWQKLQPMLPPERKPLHREQE